MSLIKIVMILAMMAQCDTECIDIPQIETPPVQLAGQASFYNSPQGDNGLRGNGVMANGELIDRRSMLIATRDVPLDTLVLLEYKGRRVWARSADRGPYGCIDGEGVWQVAVKPIEGCEYRGVADLNWPVAKELLREDMKYGLNKIKIRYYETNSPTRYSLSTFKGGKNDQN